MVKKYILGLLLIVFGTINLGVTEKYKPVSSFEISKVTADYSKLTPYIPLFQSYVDSIPTVDNFGRVRNGIIVDGIVSVLNTDPSGVKLTELELAYIRSIVGGLYLAGSWQKMKACYGFVGGNAWKHKWNWKDMRDLDEAFRITWVGGVIHSANGITGVVGGYGNTNLIPSLFLSPNNVSMSAHQSSSTSTSISEFPYIMGVSQGGSEQTGSFLGLANRVNSSRFFICTNSSNNVTAVNSMALSNYSGYVFGNNKTSIDIHMNGDNITLTRGTSAITTLPDGTIYVLDRHVIAGTSGYYNNNTFGFMHIGEGLTSQEIKQMSHIITYSQGILNRQ